MNESNYNRFLIEVLGFVRQPDGSLEWHRDPNNPPQEIPPNPFVSTRKEFSSERDS